MIPNNRMARKGFEQMKEALTEAVMKEVSQRLIKEGKKQQIVFLNKLEEYKAALKKEIIEELKRDEKG